MANLAAELTRALAHKVEHGTAGDLSLRLLAEGDGWSVEDVLCTSGPQDRSFEEQHDCYRLVIVVAGSFQYSTGLGRELMTPGSVLLANAGQCFECGHDHGAGDRCLSFGYTPELFERVMDAGGRDTDFRYTRVPPLRGLLPVIAHACAGLTQSAHSADDHARWEEISLQLAARVVDIASDGVRHLRELPPSSVARVSRVVRMIDSDPCADLSLAALSCEARLSAYHFLRMFEEMTGVTPHQYVRRARLRRAASLLAVTPDRVLDVALECGFNDVSAFNKAFRTELGVTPRAFRHGNRRVAGIV